LSEGVFAFVGLLIDYQMVAIEVDDESMRNECRFNEMTEKEETKEGIHSERISP